MEVRNPRTGKFDYQINPIGVRELTRECKRLRKSQNSWVDIGIGGRIKVLKSWKDNLLKHKNEILEKIIEDTGRKNESGIEFDSVINSIDRWCRLAPSLLENEKRQSSQFSYISIQNENVPYELVGVISPWNFPFLLSLIDALPALLAGSAVIIKPSEITPRFIRPLLQTIEQLPELSNVLTFVEGDGEVGANLVKQVDLICFTGSIRTGRRVAEEAARHFIPSFLELGGKDPAIVLKTADIDRTTSALLYASVIGMGHSCLSIERIYVDNNISEDFIVQLVEKAKQITLNDQDVESGVLGPIISESQADIIADHLKDAVEKGAKIHCGGRIENYNGGSWCRPTVLSNVDHSMKIMTEETFGPIMPIMSFDSEEKAVQLANDTNCGLSGAVFAGTVAEAENIAKNIEAGAISINDAGLTGLIHEGEKNSFKLSGLGGSRMGMASISRFIRKKLYLTNEEGTHNPWWLN